ncbi:hypothetical protein VI817_004315 [Penicillium citrinum]|nr:hypothetical protein VI817_004315 [Penicillium citrinum]
MGECARCIKRGITCPGFEKDRTFVHYNSKNRLAGSHASPEVEASQSPATIEIIQRLPLPRPVDSQPESRSQLFSSFHSNYFPLDTVGLVGADVWYHLLTGFAALPSKTGPSASLLDKSMCALTCVGLGQMKQDQQLIYYGTSLYNAAIRHMSTMIHRNAPNEELLYATVIFQRLEPLFSPFGVEAWIAHAEGTNAFLRKCYRDHPNNALIGSIYQHQKVLGASEPLKSSETTGKPAKGLFEIYGAFKPLLTGFKRLNIFNTPAACQALLRDCISHKDNIIAWFDSEYPTLGPEPTPYQNYKSTCANLPATDGVFGSAYQFPSLKSARIHVAYWTALCLIHRMIYQAKTYAIAHTGCAKILDPNTDQDYLLSWYYADEACRGIPYSLTNTEQIWGAQHVMFPISQASHIYSDMRWREKFMWCQNAYTAVAALGFGLAICLREAALKDWFAAEKSTVLPATILSMREGPQKLPVSSTGERPAQIMEIMEPLTGL